MYDSIKNTLLLLVATSTFSYADECKIMTSPLDIPTMRLGYTNWHSQTVPLYVLKTDKYTTFGEAYQDFDESITEQIKTTVCTKQKWDGVANYKIEWQTTKDSHFFIATYDVYANK